MIVRAAPYCGRSHYLALIVDVKRDVSDARCLAEIVDGERISTVSPDGSGSCLIWPGPSPQITGSQSKTSGPMPLAATPAGHFGSRTLVSATRAISPALLIPPQLALVPPKVASAVMTPFCHSYTRHWRPVP